MKGAVVASIAFFAAAFAWVAWIAIQTEITGENPLADRGPRTAAPWVLDVGDCFDDGPMRSATPR